MSYGKTTYTGVCGVCVRSLVINKMFQGYTISAYYKDYMKIHK